MNLLEILGVASMVFVGAFTYHAAFVQAHTTGQTPREAIIEAWVNLVIGFTINFIANLWLIPLMAGVELSHSANFWGGWVYTTISILRQYTIRRWFNKRLHSLARRLAGVRA
jgi:hypothetical protein